MSFQEDPYAMPSEPNHTPDIDPGKLRPKKPFWQRHLGKFTMPVIALQFLIIIILVLFLFLRPPQTITVTRLVPAPTSTPTPTQAIVPATTSIATVSPVSTAPDATSTDVTPTIQAVSGLPCKVDISSWTDGSPDWVVKAGVLYNDGSNSSTNGPTIVAPCEPGTNDYAVEAKIQVTNSSDYSCFGLDFRGSSTQDGWQGDHADVCSQDIASISSYSYDNGNTTLTQTPFTAGLTMHTYRAEVKGNTLKFFVDGTLEDTTTDNRLLTTETGQGVGLYSQNIQLQVTSFDVVSL